jgi:quercetin dioxygenase-like cupin family protein
MKIIDYREVEARRHEQTVSEEISHGVWVRPLITEEDGAPNFMMDLFEIEPGGFTPLHAHPWEHQAFVLSGEGIIRRGDADRPIKNGSVIFIAANEEHQFRNSGKQPLQLLCVIPTKISRLIHLL